MAAEPCKGMGPLLSPPTPQSGAGLLELLGHGSPRKMRAGGTMLGGPAGRGRGVSTGGEGVNGATEGRKGCSCGAGSRGPGEAGLGPAGLHELILGEREGCAPRPRASALPPGRTPAPAPCIPCGPCWVFPSRGPGAAMPPGAAMGERQDAVPWPQPNRPNPAGPISALEGGGRGGPPGWAVASRCRRKRLLGRESEGISGFSWLGLLPAGRWGLPGSSAVPVRRVPCTVPAPSHAAGSGCRKC